MIYICKICERVLDEHMTPDGVALQHTAQDGRLHEPVPVPVPKDFQGYRCDFCNDDGAAFELPVGDFRVPFDDTQNSAGAWAACTSCARLIESNRWNALINRVVERNPATVGGETDVEALRRLYRQVRANIYGALRPIAGAR